MGFISNQRWLAMRRLNSEVQQTSRRMINLQWRFVSMPFAWSRIQFVGDPIAMFLGQAFHAGAPE